MLAQINHTETVAPYVDPTLWIKGHRKLEQFKRLVEAAMALKREAVRQIEENRQ